MRLSLDRFHVAKDLKGFVGHLPEVWASVRQVLAKQDAEALLAVVEGVSKQDIAEEERENWGKYKSYLKRHRRHLNDYRKTLQAEGIDTSGMRPMGNAEAQMRVFAKRIKRGGYSWSVRGVRAMLRTIMRSKDAVQMVRAAKDQTDQRKTVQQMSMRRLLKDVTRQSVGCINGMIRMLQGPQQSSMTGMALKGLRGI